MYHFTEGHEDDVMVVNGGSMPEEICMPGTMQITTDTIIKQDLPMDLIIYMDLKKLTPFPMTIPCLDGIGSCEYEVLIFGPILLSLYTPIIIYSQLLYSHNYTIQYSHATKLSSSYTPILS